ncbi:MAG: DUF2079 domain-containing protein [Chloroflexi bacterium]|nr:DUF2079 domain-containing protein [Chloroflexota bacterium]
MLTRILALPGGRHDVGSSPARGTDLTGDATTVGAQTSSWWGAAAARSRQSVWVRASGVCLAATGLAALGWAAGFGYLAVLRHLAFGSHAEDLGFTDQVIWNFLRGQWFRMSIYSGAAAWNTELDLSRVLRPDSLLAFHFEPMLLLFVPVYALGGGAVALLVVQSVAVATGALPAYRLGEHFTRRAWCGLIVAAAYLLSPFAQWAVLADFHTSTLAAPLLLLSLERLLVARKPIQSLLAATLAASAREDVGPVLAVVGITLLVTFRPRRVGALFVALGLSWTVVSLAEIHAYSGGVSPFDVRYGATFGAGPASIALALSRPEVVVYARTLLLSGGWLGLLAPLSLLPALPSLALNVFSTSPWMAAGKAHYSGLVLPFVVLAVAIALKRFNTRPRLQVALGAGLMLTCGLGYFAEGAGPLAANYAPALLTAHALAAQRLADSVPGDAAISASTSLVPHLAHRARVYVFPAVQDADYVFVDLQASPAPTSASDVYLRVQSLLRSGVWRVDSDADGLLLLGRATGSPAPPALPSPSSTAPMRHPPTLLAANLAPSPDGAVDVDGPRWTLRTTWQTDQPLPPGAHVDFSVNLDSGEQLHIWDVALLWWSPPETWPTDQPVTVDVPNIPLHGFKSWSATWSAP